MKIFKHLLYLYELFALLQSGTFWHIFLSAATHWYKACLKKYICVSSFESHAVRAKEDAPEFEQQGLSLKHQKRQWEI